MDSMPQLGMGTFRLKEEVARQAVADALAAGFRHIDTAQFYDNEEQVGDALIASKPDRDEVFVTTKVWYEHLGTDKFMPSVYESLSKLKLDYVDLLLIHWPYPGDDIPMETYLGELAKAKQLGLTRHIGVSNFTIDQMKQAQAILGDGEIFTNQIELHPFMQNRSVVDTCRSLGIGVTAYMPFAVGKILNDDTLNAIAQQHNASPAQVVLAWLEHKNIHAIPSSTSRAHIQENAAYQRVSLTADEIARIDDLDNGERIVNPDFAPDWD
ncbi:2,5-didehydrogluconate reductase DkgB [Alteromonas sp. CYL-A6]|uniref:2,5-didehydrogluconate reductase DkgB n=1 Tax=Alteromonas nitratireducens TaxID=3390813 RepID=UPI0034B95628